MENIEKLHRILEKAFDYFGYTVITDENGLIVKLDKNYATFLKADPDLAIGKYVTDVIPHSEVPRVLETQESDIGSIFILEDGTPIVTSRVPIFDNGKLIGAMSTTIFDSLDRIKHLNQQVRKLQQENQEYKEKCLRLQNGGNPLNKIVGISETVQKAKDTVERIAATDLVVLITGETGVGKEVFANAIHQLSERRNKNFLKINCAAIPSELLESELFGYEQGAFSGARKGGKKGKFELADGGTILLDEIGDMPLQLQSKLLRVIQEQEIEPIGALKPKKINVRILCSTNCDIAENVRCGKFRMDLYYRINTVELCVPTLRSRLDDLPALCELFIADANARYGLDILGVEPDAMELLRSYSWPGNVRELKHCLERACVEKVCGSIGCEAFAFKTELILAACPVSGPIRSAEEKRCQAEHQAMIEALKLCNGNRTKAAAMIQMSRAVFFRRMKKYDIH